MSLKGGLVLSYEVLCKTLSNLLLLFWFLNWFSAFAYVWFVQSIHRRFRMYNGNRIENNKDIHTFVYDKYVFFKIVDFSFHINITIDLIPKNFYYTWALKSLYHLRFKVLIWNDCKCKKNFSMLLSHTLIALYVR